MKYTIIAAFFFISLQSFAQDTATVRNLSLQARTVEYLTPKMIDLTNDSLFNVYLNLRPKWRVTVPPTGTTLVVIDSIPTVELANFYNIMISEPEALGQAASFKTQISSARTANTYLDRLCDMYDARWAEALIGRRQAGRKLLRGK